MRVYALADDQSGRWSFWLESPFGGGSMTLRLEPQQARCLIGLNPLAFHVADALIALSGETAEDLQRLIRDRVAREAAREDYASSANAALRAYAYGEEALA